MADLPYVKTLAGDYLQRPVAGCSLAAQGLWFRLRLVMHSTEKRGWLSQNGGQPMSVDAAARRCGCSVDEYKRLVGELRGAGVMCWRDGTMGDPEIVEEERIKDIRAQAGSSGGSKTQAKARLNREYELEFENESPESLKTEEFKAAWLKWHLHRLEIGKPLTEQSRKTQLAKLNAMGPERAIAAIEHSIAAGWQGIFEPKSNSYQQGKPAQPHIEADESTQELYGKRRQQ